MNKQYETWRDFFRDSQRGLIKVKPSLGKARVEKNLVESFVFLRRKIYRDGKVVVEQLEPFEMNGCINKFLLQMEAKELSSKSLTSHYVVFKCLFRAFSGEIFSFLKQKDFDFPYGEGFGEFGFTEIRSFNTLFRIHETETITKYDIESWVAGDGSNCCRLRGFILSYKSKSNKQG